MTQIQDQDDAKNLVTACKAWAYASQLDDEDAKDEAEILIDGVLVKATGNSEIAIEDIGHADGIVEILVEIDGERHMVTVDLIGGVCTYRKI